MENRLPVPPKDMAIEIPVNAVSSGSKRKRYVDESNDYHAEVEVSEYDEHTPKRSRPHYHQSDASASEDNGGKGRLVRKKGSRNLSNLNLRHAARAQTLTQASIRESRFQEGSLTDKPSEKPPSFFTRFTRGESRNPAHVDALMEDYHANGHADREFAAHDEHVALQRVIENDHDNTKKDESKGFFQFGRQLASTFRPVALWKTIWGQSKEEIQKEQMEEEARKAKQKADAEAKYAEMKRTGQLGLQLVGAINGARSSGEEVLTPQDSAVAFDSLQSSMDASRSTSAATVLRQSQDVGANGASGDFPESSNNLTKGLKGRLNHLKKPSLVNIKSDLKRMKSDMNLAGNRESSSSISPTKNDFELPALKRSSSRLDLKKSASKMDLRKQQKLSKRVSDLENKLSQARRELDEALVEASPMPKLSGKYERFIPSTTMTRPPKFQPGKLPSLPSERILMAEQGFDVSQFDEPTSEVQPRKAIDLTLNNFMAGRSEDEGDGEDTIKASRARPYPARAQSLFNLRENDNSNHVRSKSQQSNGEKRAYEASPEPERENHTANENMDPNSITELASDATPQAPKAVDYASLDAKLKALDANVKTARKATKPKKRKSGADEDKTFKPSAVESDDDLEYTPKKKQRKDSISTNETSPNNKRTTKSGSQRSPTNKAKANGKKASPLSSSPVGKPSHTSALSQHSSDNEIHSNEEYSADERDDFRASVNSQVASLDPVHEEEEEATAGATNDTPTIPTRNPARSSSPQKRVQPGIEEQMMTRAAQAAKENPARKTRGRGSPPPNDWVKTTTTVKETVMVAPGTEGVPGLPRGANGSFDSLDVFGDDVNGIEVLRAGQGEGREEFEWPDDVF